MVDDSAWKIVGLSILKEKMGQCLLWGLSSMSKGMLQVDIHRRT